jgi:carbon starvation protein
VWPLFGSINQLLAALTLVGLSLWLAKSKRGLAIRAMVGLPMLFMMGVTITALIFQIIHGANTLLVTMGAVLLALAVWITVEAVISLWQGRPAAKQNEYEA